MGYFISDSIWGFYFGYNDKLMFVHHLLCMASNVVILMT